MQTSFTATDTSGVARLIEILPYVPDDCPNHEILELKGVIRGSNVITALPLGGSNEITALPLGCADCPAKVNPEDLCPIVTAILNNNNLLVHGLIERFGGLTPNLPCIAPYVRKI